MPALNEDTTIRLAAPERQRELRAMDHWLDRPKRGAKVIDQAKLERLMEEAEDLHATKTEDRTAELIMICAAVAVTDCVLWLWLVA